MFTEHPKQIKHRKGNQFTRVMEIIMQTEAEHCDINCLRLVRSRFHILGVNAFVYSKKTRM